MAIVVTLTPKGKIRCAVLHIEEEANRATELHPPLHSLHEAYSVMLEEFDEFWELVKVNPKKLSEEAQKERLKNLRAELTQVAAMAVRTLVDCEL